MLKTLHFKSLFLLLCLVIGGSSSAWGEGESTYIVTFDSHTSGNNNIHVISSNFNNSSYNFTYSDVEWNLSYQWKNSSGYFGTSKDFAQLGSQNNPASSVVFSTTAFAGKKIVSASLTGYCTSNTGPKISIIAGSTTMLNNQALVKTTSTQYSSTTNNVNLDENEALTFTISSTANAGICFSQIKVVYTESDIVPGTVKSPTIYPLSKEVVYGSDVQVTLTQPNAAMILYTTDGTDPSYEPLNGNKYLNPFTVNVTGEKTIKAIAFNNEGSASDISSATYNVATPVAPSVTPAAGEVAKNSTVTLSHPLYEAGLGIIRYTTNGRIPAGDSDTQNYEYNGPITIDKDMTIKAILITNGGHKGEMLTAAYTYTREDAGLAYETPSYNVPVNSSFTTPLLTNPNRLTVTYSSSNTDIATVDASTGAVTIGATEGTTTITAASAKTDNYYAGEASYTISVYDPNRKGSRWSPYTVAEALEIINAMENGTTTDDEFYVRGIVAEANDVSNSSRQQYEISDDGTTENELRVYKGKGEGNVNMTSTNKVNVGDVVVVVGNFMKYVNNSQTVIPEVAEDNYIFSIVRRTAPGISYTTSTISTHPNNGDFTAQAINNPNSLSGIIYTSSNSSVASVDAETGTVTIGSEEGSAVITATYPGPIDENYKRGTASYTINVARQDAGFSYSSTSVTLQLEETFVAPTFNNPNGVTVTFVSDNADVATVDASTGDISFVGKLGTAIITASSAQTDEYYAGVATFTINVERKDATLTVNDISMDVTTEKALNELYTTNSDGEVTITSGNTSVADIEDGKLVALSPGNATITVSIAQSDTYKAVTEEFTVTVTSKDAVAPVGPAGGNGYALVTDASTLAAGDKIIIVNSTSNGSALALSTTQNNNNRGYESVTISNQAIETISNSVQVITLEGESGAWYFNVGNGYLYAASSSSNHLKTEEEKDGNNNAKATIIINNSNVASITFQGTNTRNQLKYNSNDKIFSCYSSGQSSVYIYRLNEATEFDITIGKNGWKTLVASQNFAVPEGVTAYKVTSSTESSVHLEEITGVKKNVPVVLKGTANKTYTVSVADEANCDDNSDNLLQISTNTTGNGVYVLATKEGKTGWYKWAGGSLGAGRVYLPATTGAGAREFLSLDFDDNTTTGIDDMNVNPILPDGTVFDMQGRKVNHLKKGSLYIINGKKVVIK